MLIYLVLVYGWSLGIGALGRDFAALHDPSSLPFLADRLFALEVGLFGAWAPGYHLVNLTLLYACMLCIYRLVRVAVKGYYWLGTLAATLFMANPVHTEAVANLSGIADLVPALFALMALTAYAEHAAAPRDWKFALAFVLFPLAVLPYRENAALLLVLILLECMVVENGPDYRRLALFAIVSVAGWVVQRDAFSYAALSPAHSFVPVYLIFYPIGFLPATVRTVLAHPGLGWFAALVVLGLVVLIHRKAQRPAILFGLLSSLAIRVSQGDHFVDPVHMTGGGGLLVANALFNLALVALFHRIMDHWKWRRPVIMLTTLLAAIFFVLEIRSLAMYRYADLFVREFQARAAQVGETIGVLPDYRHYLDAPLGLHESIAHDTPFSRKHDCVPLLPIDLLPPDRAAIKALEVTDRGAMISVTGKTPLDAFPYPYQLAKPGATLATNTAKVTVTDLSTDHVTFWLEPHSGRIPFLLPIGSCDEPGAAPK